MIVFGILSGCLDKVEEIHKPELLGMPADKEWALLANYSDRTLLRNIVAMRLSEICEFSWTPRMLTET